MGLTKKMFCRSSIPREVSTSTSTFQQHEQSIQDENTDFTAGNGKETTYVEEEVAKFRLMASSWWDPHGDCKPLHSLNKLRLVDVSSFQLF